MSRTSKVLLLTLLVLFVLACNAIDQRVNQVQDAAKTVEAIGTAIPIETLQALPSVIPMETLEALPSEMPDFGNMLDPQGTPVAEWNGIPIMEQATAGEEVDATTYSFKFTGTTQEAVDFYNEQMVNLGWTSSVPSVPANEAGAFLNFQKDDQGLIIIVYTAGTNTIVTLTIG